MSEHIHQTINKLNHCVHCGKPMSELAPAQCSVICVLRVNRVVVGWTADSEWAETWARQLDGREWMPYLEIKRSKDSPNSVLGHIESDSKPTTQ